MLLLVFVPILVSFQLAASTSGPSVQLCSAQRSMTPGHGPSRASGPSPYKITASADCYSPGGTVDVELQGESGELVHGFMLQARDRSQRDTVGEFGGGGRAWTHNCDGRERASIVHRRASVGKPSIRASWTAPSTDVGTVNFVATIVKSYSTFWVKGARLELPACSGAASAAAGSSSGTRREQRADAKCSAPAPSLSKYCDEQARGRQWAERYYHSGGQCLPFWYGYCPEDNLFRDMNACERACLP